jgi:hypothetical protein
MLYHESSVMNILQTPQFNNKNNIIFKIFSKKSHKPIDIVGIRVYIIINIKKAIHF